MAQLRRDYQEFVDRETEIIAVGPEGPEAFADWWHKHQMPFIGIGDPQHVIAKMFGQKVKLLKLGRMPAQFVIDKEGQDAERALRGVNGGHHDRRGSAGSPGRDQQGEGCLVEGGIRDKWS